MALFDFDGSMDWSNPFDSAQSSYTDAGSNPGAYDPFATVGQGMFDYAKQNGFDPDQNGYGEDLTTNFNNWFNQNGFGLKQATGNGMNYWQAFQGDNPVGKSVGTSLADPVFGTVGAALAAASGNVMGLGAGLGAAGTGALSGGLGGMAASGGDPKAGLMGAVTGGLGGGLSQMYNPGAALGVENQYLQKAVNGGLSGGLKAALRGGDIASGALGGTVSPLINYGASQLGFMPSGSLPTMEGGGLDGAPNIGSQSLSDDMGESSVTMGGETPASLVGQAVGESQMNQRQAPQGVAKVMSALGLGDDSGQITGFGGQPINMGNMASGLMGLYSAFDQRRKANEMMKMMSGNFGQGGAYAKALRQQLDRRDAAGGRRSQYGPREVELQAKLAQMNASQAPALAQLYGMKSKGTNAALNNLLNLGKEVDIGSGLKSLADYFKGD